MDKRQYEYNGVVVEFDRVIAQNWQASTWAASPAKAKANLSYRFKKETNRIPSCKISLPGDLREVV